MSNQFTEIPVYLFLGFLDSGKTRFIQETLEDRRFNAGERTLLLICEEGEEEYQPSRFSGKNVYQHIMDDPSEMTAENLAGLVEKYRAARVVIEYNGMWLIQDLFDAMPDGWVVYETFFLAEAGTIEVFNSNMRNLVYDKMSNADMVVYNR